MSFFFLLLLLLLLSFPHHFFFFLFFFFYHHYHFIDFIFHVNEFKRSLYIGHTDYDKAFDSIEHEAILRALTSIGINETYITILEDIYTGATAQVHIDNQVSEDIPVLGGVRQGNPIFPKLFTATIQEVLKNAQLEEKGINTDGENCLT